MELLKDKVLECPQGGQANNSPHQYKGYFGYAFNKYFCR
jgi:hypothetical protein